MILNPESQNMTFLERLRTSTANAWLQRVLRPLQFLSSVLSLGFFSARLARILRLARSNYNHGEGAVEGILAAAVLYNLLATLLRMCLKHGGPTPVRWFLVVADVLFIGGFIAVAALTRPRGGSAGPNGGDCGTDSFAARAVPRSYRNDHGCNLPWGTFVLAIIST